MAGGIDNQDQGDQQQQQQQELQSVVPPSPMSTVPPARTDSKHPHQGASRKPSHTSPSKVASAADANDEDNFNAGNGTGHSQRQQDVIPQQSQQHLV
jgi:hypothetical protein